MAPLHAGPDTLGHALTDAGLGVLLGLALVTCLFYVLYRRIGGHGKQRA